jgi:hypothetical protein
MAEAEGRYFAHVAGHTRGGSGLAFCSSRCPTCHRERQSLRRSPDKNESLRAKRGVTFEAVVVAVEARGLLDILGHPNPAKYSRQRILVVELDGYVHLVPFVEEKDHFFLKTIIPSRKATRDYLKLGGDDVES